MLGLRPMREDDVAATYEITVAALADLAGRRGEPPDPVSPARQAHLRIRHLLTTDPEGAWVVERPDGHLAGAALALRRGGLWGLSLLMVSPAEQGSGVGGALLRRTLEYASGARGSVILSSGDARALFAYAGAGFSFHPAATAHGEPRAVGPSRAVRAFEPADQAMADLVDRSLRGAPHGEDLSVMAEAGYELLVFPGRGYAARRGGELGLLAAADEEAARELLRSVLHRVPPGEQATIRFLTGAQQWATEVAVDAGLALRVDLGVFLRGEVGRFTPYLPSGAYL